MAEGTERIRKRQRTMAASFAIELSSFLLNLTGAILSNSLTLWANALRVALDTAASAFAFYVTRRIARGRDEHFDYGLGKWENLSALFNALVMFTALIYIGAQAFHRLANPKEVTGEEFGTVVLAFYLTVNFVMLLRFAWLGKRDPSPIVTAQFVLYRNATAATAISLAIVVISGHPELFPWGRHVDPIGAMILSAIILFGMVGLMKQSLSALLDESLDEALQLRIIRGLTDSFDQYRQIQKIRTRRSGERIFIELFLEFDPDLSVGDALERASLIREKVETLIPNSEAFVVICEPLQPAKLAG